MMFDDLIKKGTNEYEDLLKQGSINVGLLDTGSYYLNAQQSGTLFGGFPEKQITTLAGQKATGKSYILLKIIKLFLKRHPTGRVILFETEFYITEEKQILQERGIDPARVKILHVRTIESFHKQTYDIVQAVKKSALKDRTPLLLALDSFGNLSTEKEVDDVEEGENKVDMTKAKLAKRLFRTLTLDLGVCGIPLIATNHIYKEQGGANPKYAKTVMTGGEALYYNSSNILFLTKSKVTENDEVVGVKIRAHNEKCRDAKENTDIELLLNYDSGLSRYGGLIDLAVEAKLVEVVKGKYQFPGKKPNFASVIYKSPQKYFTQEFLLELDEFCKKRFRYGKPGDEVVEEEGDGEDI